MTPSPANRRVGIPLVLLAGIFWSTSGILYRLIQEATPWQVLLYRSLALMAALPLWLAYRHRSQMRQTLSRAGLPALVAEELNADLGPGVEGGVPRRLERVGGAVVAVRFPRTGLSR